MSVATDPRPHSHLRRLAQWVATEGATLGLTNYADTDTAYAQAVAPSLALSRMLAAPPIGDWAEIGAGSGALGLGLAISAPSAHVALLDRRQRSVAFIDLLIRRHPLHNASAILADATDLPEASLLGVAFRALAAPERALAIAGRLSRRYVAAFHAPGIADYDRPPGGFHVLQRDSCAAPGLALTLYCRI